METVLIGHTAGLDRVTVNGKAAVETVFKGPGVGQVAIDPNDSTRVYIATLGEGVWRSVDSGKTFEQAPGEINPYCWSIVASASDVKDGIGAIYVGTETSHIFRSYDGGDTFEELTSVQEISDKRTWSFPPAPDTHHVHQITLDGADPDKVVMGVELGGTYFSADRGKSWTRTTADPDPHTLRTHPVETSRMYQGGGASYHFSLDGGKTWELCVDGIEDRVRYFYSVAVDSGDPDNVVLVGGPDPFGGHGIIPGVPVWSTVLRRQGDGPWETLTAGLPPGEGTPMGTFSAGAPGVFYYVTDPGDIFRSDDGATTFSKIEYENSRVAGTVRAVSVHPS